MSINGRLARFSSQKTAPDYTSRSQKSENSQPGKENKGSVLASYDKHPETQQNSRVCQPARSLPSEPEAGREMATCPVCNAELTLMDLPAQQHHINACLDRGESAPGAIKQPSTDLFNSSKQGDIGPWLVSLGLACYQSRFEQEQIGLDCIALLDDEDFKDLGVTAEHARMLKQAVPAPPKPNELDSSRVLALRTASSSQGRIQEAAKPKPAEQAGGAKAALPSYFIGGASKRQKLQSGVILRPPQAKAAPGRPPPLSMSLSCRRDSSYSRSVEASLFTALFQTHTEPQVPETNTPIETVVQTPLEIRSESARVVESEKTLWRSASGSLQDTRGVLVTPLPKRIAARKLRRLAIKEAVLKSVEAHGGGCKPTEKAVSCVETIAKSPRFASTAAPDKSGIIPTSAKALQLQALKTELQAAETTVAELKKSIAELETC